MVSGAGLASFIELDNGNLSFGLSYGIIKTWNQEDGTFLKKLTGHSRDRGGYVFSVTQLKNGYLISGASDNTIKMWNLNNDKCMKTFIGNDGWVKQVIELENGKFVSGSSDKTIKILDIELLCEALIIMNEGITFDDLLELMRGKTTLNKMAAYRLYPFIVQNFFDLTIKYNT